MYRIDNATAVAVIPVPAAVGPNPNCYFFKGNPGGGIPATIVDDDWANAVQEEICNAITGFGVALDKTKRDQLSSILLGTVGGYFRRRLSGATNFYVRTDGNDSNTGLVNTALGAFLTIQGAVNALYKLWDLNNFLATVNIGAGTFAGWRVDSQMLGQAGVPLLFNGAGGTTIVTSTIIGSGAASFRYQNMSIGTTVDSCVIASSGARLFQGVGITLTGCQNTAAAGLLSVGQAGLLQIEQNFTIANPGTIPSVFHSESSGLVFGTGVTITHSGTCTIAQAYAYSYFVGNINLPGVTFSGAGGVTGKRYDANYNSFIYTSAGGANYFPGSVAGTTSNQGLYS